MSHQQPQQKKLFTGSLWDNPIAKQAEKNLDQASIDRLKTAGKRMYNTIDYSNATPLCEDQQVDAVAKITEFIKSGMHPSYLENNEIELLKNTYGPEWYTRFDYTKDDLDTIR